MTLMLGKDFKTAVYFTYAQGPKGRDNYEWAKNFSKDV